ncbi:MAG: hypothetical protein VKI63_04720 [Cyanobium sp.]|nr:hypothetical protein [Cyanobium sp.]
MVLFTLLAGLAVLLTFSLGLQWLALGLRGPIESSIGLLMQLSALFLAAAVLLLPFGRHRVAAGALALAWLFSHAVTQLDNRQLQEINRQGELFDARQNQKWNNEALNEALLQVNCDGGKLLVLRKFNFAGGNSKMSVVLVPVNRTRPSKVLFTVFDDGLELQNPGFLPEHRRRLHAYARQGDIACRKGIAAMEQQLEAYSASRSLS